MTAVLLIISTVCTVSFAVGLIKGEKYMNLVQDLDSGSYPLKTLYISGFYLSSTKLFALRGGLAKKLLREASLLYSETYYEYYAQLVWAQFISLSLVLLDLLLPFASLMGTNVDAVFTVIAVVGVVLFWRMSIGKMGEEISRRKESCLYDFPDMVLKLALLINSGMILRDAWRLTATRKEGELYKIMRRSCELMDHGESDAEALHTFGVLCDTAEIKKFANVMTQGLEKGNKELAAFLTAQTSELWEFKRQRVLRRGEIAAGKLIAPLGMSFIGIILIIIACAAQSMSF